MIVFATSMLILNWMLSTLNWLQLEKDTIVFSRAALQQNEILFAPLIIVFLFVTVKLIW